LVQSGLADDSLLEKKGSAGLMGARKLRVGKDTYWLITLDS